MPAALWDVDGTLVDTAGQHFAAWQELAASIGRPYSRADFDHTFGWRNPEILRHLFDPAMTDAECADLGLRKETIYRDMVGAGRVDLLPGVGRLLAEFAAAGWRQAVGSSAPKGNLDLLLASAGIGHYFAAVVSGDDVKRGKPAPDVFAQGAALLDVPAVECVVLEDAVAGVEAARNAGMACVAVRSGPHHSAQALRSAGAGIVVESLDHLHLPEVEALLISRR